MYYVPLWKTINYWEIFTQHFIYQRNLCRIYILLEGKKFSFSQGGRRENCEYIIGSTEINKLNLLRSKLQRPWALSCMNRGCFLLLTPTQKGAHNSRTGLFHSYNCTKDYTSVELTLINSLRIAWNWIPYLSTIQEIIRNSNEKKLVVLSIAVTVNVLFIWTQANHLMRFLVIIIFATYNNLWHISVSCHHVPKRCYIGLILNSFSSGWFE